MKFTWVAWFKQCLVSPVKTWDVQLLPTAFDLVVLAKITVKQGESGLRDFGHGDFIQTIFSSLGKGDEELPF